MKLCRARNIPVEQRNLPDVWTKYIAHVQPLTIAVSDKLSIFFQALTFTILYVNRQRKPESPYFFKKKHEMD